MLLPRPALCVTIPNQARSWKSLNRIIKVLLSALYSAGWITLLLLLFLTNPWLGALFTIICIIIGTWLVLNLFLAVLLDNLDQIQESDISSVPSLVIKQQSAADDMFRRFAESFTSRDGLRALRSRSDLSVDRQLPMQGERQPSLWLPNAQEQERQQQGGWGSAEFEEEDTSGSQPAAPMTTLGNKRRAAGTSVSFNNVAPLPPALMVELPALKPLPKVPSDDSARLANDWSVGTDVMDGKQQADHHSASRAVSSANVLAASAHHSFSNRQGGPMPPYLDRQGSQTPLIAVPVLHGRSLFLFSGTNVLRRHLHQLCNSRGFENIMLLLILASCLELCFDDVSVQPGTPKDKVLRALELFFAIVFGLEALVKVIDTGLLFNGPDSYLRSGWNVLDLLVVVVAVLVLVLQPIMNTGYIVWLRAFRALR